MSLFALRVVISFFVGGLFIALLTLIAERVPRKISGIILMFPSTVFLGYFFLGWTLSPAAVAHAVPASIVTTGVNIFYIILYIFIANRGFLSGKGKLYQIAMSFLFSFPVWLGAAVLIIHLKPSNVFLALAAYFLLLILGWIILQKRTEVPLRRFTYTSGQKLGRAIFSGCVIALVVILGKVLGPFWGGVFAAFPAAITSSMAIFHWYYEPRELFSLIRSIPLGSLSTVSFMLLAMICFPKFGIIIGTILGLAGSFLVAWVLSSLHLSRKS